MEQLPLETPVLQEDRRHVSFWNGRVLTAEDLRAEQTANRRQRRALGRLHGEGVVVGLEVELGSSPARTVHVHPGMAVAATGDVLEVEDQVEVRLVPQQSGEVGPKGTFVPCETVEGTITDSGVYLLALRAVVGPHGAAAKVPFGGDGSASECGPRYEVGGVAFRLVELKLGTLVTGSGLNAKDLLELLISAELQDRSLARNLLAYLLSGAGLLDAFYADPFGSDHGVDPVRDAAPKLTDEDVPLALIAWNVDRVAFCDVWSVRRRPTVPSGSGWAVPIAARQVATGEARLLQFQEHLAWVVDRTTRSDAPVRIDQVRVLDWFHYLPPVAAVPLRGLRDEESSAGPAFEAGRFFEGLTVRPRLDGAHDDSPLYISRSRAGALLRSSFDHAPIDLPAEQLLWVYGLIENRHGSGDDFRVPYGLIVGAELPFAGNGQFDRTRFDLGNIASDTDLAHEEA